MPYLCEDSHAGAQHFVQVLGRLGLPQPGARLLVAGCGRGHEAAFLHARLGVPTTAFDVDLPEDLPEGPEFLQASVQGLPFGEASWDLAFFHHVIEHVPDPDGALAELSRVMRPGGVLYVGTPNRARLLGYVGSRDASLRDKVAWNLADYRARARGRFRNEFGAHAGFTGRELHGLLRRHFGEVHSLTADYLRFKYGPRLPRPVLSALVSRPALHVVPPSVYALARRA